MNADIRERDFESFFAAPFNAYETDSNYVSPMKTDLKSMLDTNKNPLFSSENDFSYFTAHHNGLALGRIVVHAHHASNKVHKTNQANFGFFDCIDDNEIAKALLSTAEEWAVMRGFKEIVGNFNLTAMQQCGVQTGGFENQGYTDMVQNPPHISRLLEANGYKARFPMSTFELEVDKAEFTNKVLPKEDNYSFAKITKENFPLHMEEARIVLNDGFADNPMFVPLTSEEFIFQAGEMMTILDPRLSSVVHANGKPVGVVICIPDLNGFLRSTKSRISLWTPFHFLRYRVNRQRAVIIFYSVSRSQHGKGIMGAMLDRTLTELRSASYKQLGITWIADINKASLRQMEKLGAKPLHHLNLFHKELK